MNGYCWQCQIECTLQRTESTPLPAEDGAEVTLDIFKCPQCGEENAVITIPEPAP